MASIKTHLFAGHDDGSESCDFRGQNAIGKPDGDEHRTIPQTETDPASQDAVDIALVAGPKANAKVQDGLKELLGENYGATAKVVHELLGGDGSATVFGLRVGVWDE